MTDFDELEHALAELEARVALASRGRAAVPRALDPALKRYLAAQQYHEAHHTEPHEADQVADRRATAGT
jgi:hypothetical protein